MTAIFRETILKVKGIGRLTLLIMGYMLLCLPAFSQRKKQRTDTTALVREFITVCNQYKQMPLHLSVQQHSSATIVVSAEDTLMTTAEFYLTAQGAYIRYGHTEQLINDSLLLMVSLDQQVMMLSPNTTSVQQQVKNYLGWQLHDSSVLTTAAAYASSALPAGPGKAIIELRNRLPLPGTDLTKETITLKYDVNSKQPEQVIYMRRSLIPVDKADIDTTGNTTPISRFVTIGDNYFVMNERKMVFDYRSITHDVSAMLPVSMGDRIRINSDGKYIPAKGYENYYLSTD